MNVQSSRLTRFVFNKTFAGPGIYAISTALAAFAALVLTRLLWQRLDPVAFATWVLLDPLVPMAAASLLLGTDHGAVKQVRSDGEPAAKVVGTLLAGAAPVLLPGAALLGWAVTATVGAGWGGWLSLILVSEAALLMLQTAARAGGRPVLFGVLQVGRSMGYVAVLLLALPDERNPTTLDDVFRLRGLWSMALALIGLVALRPCFSLSATRQYNALRYGLPILVAMLLTTVLDVADRMALAAVSDATEVGFYAIHLKSASLLSQAVVVPFGLWFGPERLRHVRDADGGTAFFRRTATVLLALMMMLAGGVWLARDAVFALIAPGSVASGPLLALCLAPTVALGMMQVLNIGLLLPGHTVKNILPTGAGAVGSALLSCLLVPFAGATGAALARTLAFCSVTAANALWSARIYPLPFPIAAMLVFPAAATVGLGLLDAMAVAAAPRLGSDGAMALALGCWALLGSGLSAALLHAANLRPPFAIGTARFYPMPRGNGP